MARGRPAEAGRSTPYAPCRQQQCHPLCSSLPHCSSRHSPCDRRDGGGGCPVHPHPLVPRKQRQPQRQGLRSQLLPRPSQGHHRRVRVQSTEAAHPRTTFEFAECVDSSGSSTRSGRSLVTTAFSPTFGPGRLSNWRRRGGRTWRTRKRSARIDASGMTRTMRLPISSPCTMKSQNTGPTLSPTATLATFNTLQPSQSMSKAALYTSDWAAFLAAEAKVKNEFEGNVIDLGVFRLIFLIFTLSNENNLIQDLSILLQNLRQCSTLWVVVRPRSSFPRRESSGSRVAPRRRTSPTPQSSTAKASGALWLVKTATLLTSLLDATLAWCHSLSTQSALSPSSSASTTRAAKPSLPRETRAPSCGTRRTAKLASLANSTLQITKAARPATMLLIAPLAGTSWTRSGRSSSTPSSTAPPGQLENNIVGFLLSISTLLLLLRLVLLGPRFTAGRGSFSVT